MDIGFLLASRFVISSRILSGEESEAGVELRWISAVPSLQDASTFPTVQSA